MSRSRKLSIDEAITRARKAVKQGRLSIASELYSAVLKQQPGHPVARKGLRKLQRASARKRPESAAAINPPKDQIDAVIGLCYAGQIEEAEQSGEALLKKYPNSVVLLNVLGTAQQMQGKFERAVQSFDRAIALRPGFAEAHSNRANALKSLGRLDEAVASYDEAIRLKPDYTEAHYNRGNGLKDSGRLEEAAHSYEKAIRLRPDFAAAHRNLSTLKKYTRDDAQIAVMESQLTEPTANPAARVEFCFALAKAYEDLGDYERSFGYVEDGNRLRKKLLSYDIESDRILFAEIKRVASAVLPTADMVSVVPLAKQPLFIVGMMRSGTSLVEQILASHSQVHGAGELEAMNRLLGPMFPDLSRGDDRGLSAIDFSRIRNSYLDELSALHVREKTVTDKMPLNFRWIGFILAAFPEAKVVHVKRDPVATCWSIYKHYFPDEGNGYAYDLDDLAAYYALYVDLIAFWRERYPDKICDLSYEALTEDQEQETRRLLSFCNLAWEEQCLEFHKTERIVKTASALQVREEMYTGSSEAWRNYARHLQGLIRVLRT